MLKQCSLGLDIQIRFASALLMETGTWGIASEKSVLDLERQSAHPAGDPHEILVAGHGSVGQHHRRRGVAVFILEPPSQTPRIDAISDRSSAAQPQPVAILGLQVGHDRTVAQGPSDAVAACEQLLGHDAAEAAREICPQLTFVSGHFNDYQRLDDAAMKLLGDFTPLVERISIDEAFADVAGCIHLFGPPPEMAKVIRRRVRTELGLPISVGVARTKHLAKVASQSGRTAMARPPQ
jgi:hypothetical protein